MKTLSASNKSIDKTIFFNLIAVSMLMLSLPSKASALIVCKNGVYVKLHFRYLWGAIEFDPIDNLYLYSDTVSVDSSYTPTITGSSGIGTWSYEYVTTDHNGNSFPGGVEGIHFYLTSGDGISNGEYADFTFSALSSSSGQWYADYHDSASSIWTNGVPGQPCPEPATIMLMGLGALGMFGMKHGKCREADVA